jgi:hypothetical protein
MNRCGLAFIACLAATIAAGCARSAAVPAASPVLPKSATAAETIAGLMRWPAAVTPVASWIAPAAKSSPLVYVSDFEHDSVSIFDADTSTLLGQIGGLSAAAGLYVDRRHRLWVANSGNDQVLVFDRGATSPSETLSDPQQRPFDAAVCPNGTVYVSNYYSFQTGFGSISVYAKGSTSPTGSLSDPNEFENYFVTCDAKGNVFTTLELGNLANQVDEYAGGAPPALKVLPVDSAGGIVIDKAGNLVVADPDAHTIAEYTESGAATGNTIATGSSRLIFGIALSRNGKSVLGANAGGSGQSFAVWGGTPLLSYVTSFVEPIGAAYDPALRPKK